MWISVLHWGLNSARPFPAGSASLPCRAESPRVLQSSVPSLQDGSGHPGGLQEQDPALPRSHKPGWSLQEPLGSKATKKGSWVTPQPREKKKKKTNMNPTATCTKISSRGNDTEMSWKSAKVGFLLFLSLLSEQGVIGLEGRSKAWV